MKNYSVKPYQISDYKIWNAFISKAKNATFLFHRDFIEYHLDRFQDYSLLIFEADKIIAVLPANRVGEIIYSHQGLTYGGLIYKEERKLTEVISIFSVILSFLDQNGIQKLHFKTTPSIYHLKPAEEILYALFLAEAKLKRRDSLSVIDLSQENNFSKIRKRQIQNGIQNGLLVKEENNFESFWKKILIPNLFERHHVAPIHSLEEITRLKSLFPENIRQFNVYYRDQIVAGTTIFLSERVAHCQYISKFENDQNLGSLDFLFDFLINKEFLTKHFFDFGSSNEDQGKKLNGGLSYWKESFGAATIVHDFYEVETTNYYKLDQAVL